MPVTRRPSPRSATLVVAASDSSVLSKKAADYICDGTDDHVEIEAAIAALPSGGGKIVLMEGLFTIGATIDIVKSNVTIEGQGESSIIKAKASLNADLIKLGDGSTAVSNISLRRVKIDGNNAGTQTSGHSVSVTAAADFCSIVGCYIYDSTDCGIEVLGDNLLVEGCYIDKNNLNRGFELIGLGSASTEGNKARIIGNTLTNIGEVGIGLYGDEVVISNNTIGPSQATATGKGIFISGDVSVISGNYIYGCFKPIFSDALETVISSNFIYVSQDLTSAAIELQGNLPTANDNYIYTLSSLTSVVVGIKVYGNQGKISDNVVYMNHSAANIAFQTSTANNTSFTGNLAHTSQSNVSGSRGFDLDIINGVISNNVVFQYEIAYDLTGCDRSTFSGNGCEDCNNGVLLTGCDEISVVGNSLDGNSTTGGYAIKSLNSSLVTGNSIVGNTIINWAEDGIYLQCVGYSTISENIIKNVGLKTDNTYNGIFLAGTGGVYSIYNNISGNVIRNDQANDPIYGIREDSSSDGPSIITNNIVLDNETAQISAQHASTIVANNIEV